MRETRNGGASVGPSIAFVAGLVALTVWRVGPGQIGAALRTAGFCVIPLLAISMGWKC